MKQEIQILPSPRKVRESDLDIECGFVYSYPIHGHLYYEILIYDTFEGEITVSGVQFDPKAPTAVLVAPNDFHSITVRSKENISYYKILISRAYFEDSLHLSSSSSVSQDEKRHALLKTLVTEAYRNRHDHAYLEAYVRAIIQTLQKTAEQIIRSGKSTTLIREAIETIHTQFTEPITLQSTASALHVSPQYLSNLFSRYAQMSFIEYLTRRRLHYAAALLQNGSSVSEACFHCGYRNLSHFIRSFKRYFGVTPAKYQ